MDITKTPAPTAEADAPEDKAAVDTAADSTELVDTEYDADLDAEFDGEAEAEDAESAVVGAAAGAVVAAGLGLVALSGTWVSRVIGERQTLIGQLDAANATTTQEKIAALYGDAWHMTALVNGVVSTLALLIAVFVLARPAFGAPGRTLPAWVRSVSWAAVALGILGVLLFGLMYFDLLVPMPTAAE
ncbi:hypothetical protein ACWDYJ_19760 [Streptomyces sp. NPDC003042]